jgi:hypothetical protein
MDAEAIIKALDRTGIKYSIVGSYSLKMAGYKVKPGDIDVVVAKKDVEKAKSATAGFGSDVEVYEGAVKGKPYTPQEFRDFFLSKFITDDMMIGKLARHAVDEPKVLALFEGTEIIFVLESMAKDIGRKLVAK